MAINPKKNSLRKVLLEKRDNTSYDLINIASRQIHSNLKKIPDFTNAQSIACYYPIGSEVLTQDIMLEAMSKGKDILLPKVIEKNLVFRKVVDLLSLEKGKFGIMEPKDQWPEIEDIDVIIVPAVGVSLSGARLGYGHGYYDRFLSKINTAVIAITYAKQVVKSIPTSKHDVKMDWLVTEEKYYKF